MNTKIDDDRKFLLEKTAFKPPVTDEMKIIALRLWISQVIKQVAEKKTSITDLYQSYAGWTKEKDIEAVLFQKPAPFSRALSKILAEKGIPHTRQREANTRYLSGIELSEKAVLALKEKG